MFSQRIQPLYCESLKYICRTRHNYNAYLDYLNNANGSTSRAAYSKYQALYTDSKSCTIISQELNQIDGIMVTGYLPSSSQVRVV